MSLQEKIKHSLPDLLIFPLANIVCSFVPKPVFIAMRRCREWGRMVRVKWVLDRLRWNIQCFGDRDLYYGTNPERTIDPFWITLPRSPQHSIELLPEWKFIVKESMFVLKLHKG